MVVKLLASGMATVLLVLACSGDRQATPSPPRIHGTPAADNRLADLTVKVDLLLSEHLVWVAKTSAAALGGRPEEQAAYADLLDQNGAELASVVEAAYGAGARSRFGEIWSAQNGLLAEYTQALASGDAARPAAPLAKLFEAFVPAIAEFISRNAGLSLASVANLEVGQVLAAKQVIDDQASKNWLGAYTALRRGLGQVPQLGDPLAQAVAGRQPPKTSSDPAGRVLALRVSLDLLLQEHLYLASSTTAAAIGGRSDEFPAAARALSDNGSELGATIGSLYGTATQARFDQLWRSHNGLLIDYASALITRDKSAQERARTGLIDAYVSQFAELISSSTGLAKTAVADLARAQLLSTIGLIDAQGAKDGRGVASWDRAAAGRMQSLGDPLAAAMATKLTGTS